MDKKWIVLLLLILTLAGCGDEEKPTATQTPAPPTETPVEATAEPSVEPTSPPVPSSTPAVAQDGVLISEMLPGIAGLSNNLEFIELYNAGTEAVDLNGWSLWYQMDDNKEEQLVYAWETRADLPPHGHYLLTRAGQEVGNLADAEYDLSLFEARGGLALCDPEGQRVDSLVWGEGPSDYLAGSPAPAPEGGASLERRPGGEAGNGVDSGDQAADFIQAAPNPQNSGDPITPLPDERLSVRLDLPQSVEPGDEVAYTLEIHNQTSRPVHQVRVLAPLPPEFQVVALPTGADVRDGWIAWQINELASGATAIGRVNLSAPWTYLDVLIRGYFVEADDWEQPAYGPIQPFAVAGGSIPISVARTLEGRTVTVEGVATMYTGGFYAGGSGTKFYLEDESGGIQVYCPGGAGQVSVEVGDQVRVSGEIEVYRDSLEIVPSTYPDDVEVIASGAEPEPQEVSLNAARSQESLLGSLIQITGTASRIQEFSYSYEIDLIDDEGNILLAYVEKDTGFSVEPLEPGKRYRVTGIYESYDGIWELKPRRQSDFAEIYPPELMLDMAGPNSAQPGQTVTYTLTVYNHTPDPLSNVQVVASPSIENVFVEDILDGGEQVGANVVWTLPELPGEGGSAVARYRATVGQEASGRFVTEGASATADQWPEPVVTPPLLTFIGGGVPVWAIQGEGAESPYVRGEATTEGIVTGVFPEMAGFWIQSAEPDDDPLTSEGLFVLSGELEVALDLGDLVRIRGQVREVSGQTLLDLTSLDDLELLDSGLDLPQPVEIDPPQDSQSAQAYLEALEGMLVQVSEPALAVAPTSKYGEAVLVRPRWGVERIMRGEPMGMAIFVDDGSSATHYNQETLPFAIQSGDLVSGAVGPLAYTYDNYKIEPIAIPVISRTERLLPALDPLEPGQFSVATFNVENLFDFRPPHPSDPPPPSVSEYRLKLAKTADAILAMGAPTILGLQEVENVDILADLAEQEALAEYGYQPVLIEGTDSRGIDVGYLVRSDQATVEGAAAYPAPEGLTSRPPLFITVTLGLESGGGTVYVFNNHFTSMSGGEEATEPRRTAQAEWNGSLVERILADDPEAYVLVLGDLNSFYQSAPLDALRETGLRHVYEFVEPYRPYSYIYQGESETLDHILMTPALYEYLVGVEAVHINADYPPPVSDDPSARRVSDHDPVVAIFALGP